VLSGVLDVFIDGQWRELGPGARLTVPAGAPHTIRNLHREEMRALNVHAPALDFPDFMAGLHELVHSGKVRALPPKDPRSVIHLSMLFTAHERTLAPAKPPQRLMRVLAFVGRAARLPASPPNSARRRAIRSTVALRCECGHARFAAARPIGSPEDFGSGTPSGTSPASRGPRDRGRFDRLEDVGSDRRDARTARCR
jgi:hypothetical protein